MFWLLVTAGKCSVIVMISSPVLIQECLAARAGTCEHTPARLLYPSYIFGTSLLLVPCYLCEDCRGMGRMLWKSVSMEN